MVTTDTYKWGNRPVVISPSLKLSRNDGLTEVISKVVNVVEDMYLPKAVIALTGAVDTVSGTGSVAGTGNTIISYAWTKESGPEAATINTPTVATTGILGLIIGDSITVKLEVINSKGDKASTIFTYTKII